MTFMAIGVLLSQKCCFFHGQLGLCVFKAVIATVLDSVVCDVVFQWHFSGNVVVTTGIHLLLVKLDFELDTWQRPLLEHLICGMYASVVDAASPEEPIVLMVLVDSGNPQREKLWNQ
uniref:Uncharacterized protein n=1 Tax=Trieres chinensis TaxID=1514140 RepID=A0A7S1ZWX9_TRICV|mmetsp:Transcript_34371/g.70201  ORF Transcript_34371/g.70201 Transcript_34371/m.70201 type:complete len:117 (+) Transcript_34371:82-432(+)